MSSLRIGMVGFDITPRIHPDYGAWGTTPSMTEIDMPLLSRCLVLEQGKRRLIWYGSDLVGDSPSMTDRLRDEVAQALGLSREQVLWGTDQNHSSGAPPWSQFTGAVTTNVSEQDPAFIASEEKRLLKAFIDAAREAIDRLEPATVWAGRGYCDSVSFNTRHPMPNGGLKYCRRYDEGIRGNRPIDPVIGLVRFDDARGKPIGAIFNFNMHPATMIDEKMISPEWVGPARGCIENALDGAPVLFCQGFCSDICCYHMFGTPTQAYQTGKRLGKAAVEALPTLVPVRSEPLLFLHETIELQCLPMPSRQQFETEIAVMQDYVDGLQENPDMLWCGGINLPDQLGPEIRAKIIESKIAYRLAGIRMLEQNQSPPTSLPITVGAVRIGDVAAVLSPGENYAEVGIAVRARSPFVHTLVCGDVNGLFGNVFTDEEIDRGGYTSDSYFEILAFAGFRLPPAKGSAKKVTDTFIQLLDRLHGSPKGDDY